MAAIFAAHLAGMTAVILAWHLADLMAAIYVVHLVNKNNDFKDTF